MAPASCAKNRISFIALLSGCEVGDAVCKIFGGDATPQECLRIWLKVQSRQDVAASRAANDDGDVAPFYQAAVDPLPLKV